MKKRKLNSKNPKYWSKKKLEGPRIKKKILMCTTHNNVKVYGVWYEKD
tara:strand:+ start:92 stop:235 length:144 start_codon:yes stop_codon:yes gene_type:complete